MPRRHVTHEKWESVFSQLLDTAPSAEELEAASAGVPVSPLLAPRRGLRSSSSGADVAALEESNMSHVVAGVMTPAALDDVEAGMSGDARPSTSVLQDDGDGSPTSVNDAANRPVADDAADEQADGREDAAADTPESVDDVAAVADIAGNLVADAKEDKIPTLIEPRASWWDARIAGPLASDAPSNAASPEGADRAPRSPSAQTAPCSPSHTTAASPEASFAYPQLMSTGGGGLPSAGASMTSMPGSPRLPGTTSADFQSPSPPRGGAAAAGPSASPQHPADPIAEGLAQPARPKQFRVRNRKMVVFLSDAAFLRLIGVSQPVSMTMSGGHAAVDVVAAMLRHVRAAYATQLQQHNQWLNPAHFNVMMANSDGTPDDDMRIVLSGDRAVDNEYVLLVPRADCLDAAYASHASKARQGAHARHGRASLEVIVKHEVDPEATSVTRHYTLSALTDLQVRHLPEFLCKELFLTGLSPAPSSASGSPRGGSDMSVEEQSLLIMYNGTEVRVSRSPFFSLCDAPSGVPLWDQTLLQLARAGVRAVGFTTRHEAPQRLRLDTKSLGGGSFESMPTSGGSGGSSFVDRGDHSPTHAASSAVLSAAELVRITHMDDIEALAYRTYVVRKRNERKVWQQRCFSVDKDFIYNQLVDEQAGATKRPMRRIVDVESTVISKDDPKHCVVTYKRGPTVMTSGVARDELEFESAMECKHFVTKIGILQRLALQHATAPGHPGGASPNFAQKPSVSQRFLNLFK